MIIFDDVYSGESIVDVERDIYEAINYSEIPQDEHGFMMGEFKITIDWQESFDED